MIGSDLSYPLNCSHRMLSNAGSSLSPDVKSKGTVKIAERVDELEASMG